MDEINKWERVLDTASKSLGTKAGKDTNELVYADAYQQLVSLGARSQLRRKYRRQS